MINENKQKHLQTLTNEYVQAFLHFAMKRTNQFVDAEELTQEMMYHCIRAIQNHDHIEDLNAFLWSIAHNTYKSWLYRNKRANAFYIDDVFNIGQIIDQSPEVDTQLLQNETFYFLRKKISTLTNFYRKTLVYFYYDEMSINEIAEKLHLSVSMVKYYLSRGREQLREAYTMDKLVGEKSYNPSDFAIYCLSRGLTDGKIWTLFERKLPSQIVLICYEQPATITDICLETGTPSAFIEDEIQILLDGGVLLEISKGKYQTNMFILKKQALDRLQKEFGQWVSVYASRVVESFYKYLLRLKRSDIFKYDAEEQRYAWFYAQEVPHFDESIIQIAEKDYPVILSCGSPAFVYGVESTHSPWGYGKSGIHFKKFAVWPCDIGILGTPRHQANLLNHTDRARSLYEVYAGTLNDEKKEVYAQLIADGYVFKQNNSLICDVAVSTAKSRELFEEINNELLEFLQPLSKKTYESMFQLVKSTVPPQLKNYAKGYTHVLIQYFVRITLF